MRRVLEWHNPENVVDHNPENVDDDLVQDTFFLDKFIRGRATGTHNKSDGSVRGLVAGLRR